MSYVGAGYLSPYYQSNRASLISTERSRRHNSSITPRRSNSREIKFEIAVNNITNINASINGLLRIVDNSKRSQMSQLPYHQNHKSPYSPSKYEKITPQSSFKEGSRQNGSTQNRKYRSPYSVKQDIRQTTHALIKYSNKKQQKSKHSPIKAVNQHQVNDWWQNLLNEVDETNKNKVLLQKDKQNQTNYSKELF